MIIGERNWVWNKMYCLPIALLPVQTIRNIFKVRNYRTKKLRIHQTPGYRRGKYLTCPRQLYIMLLL